MSYQYEQDKNKNLKGVNKMEINRKCVVKTYRVEIVSRVEQRYAMWCDECGSTVKLASLQEAAEIARTNTGEIIRQAAQGKIHLGFRPEALFFCLDSLLCGREFSKTSL